MTRSNQRPASPGIQYWYWIIGPIVSLGLIWLVMFWTAVPKLQASDDALKTVDALFTAINSRNTKRMSECKTKLESYTREGGLSHGAMTVLAQCCEQAEAGDWEKAAKRLYDVIDKQ